MAISLASSDGWYEPSTSVREAPRRISFTNNTVINRPMVQAWRSAPSAASGDNRTGKHKRHQDAKPEPSHLPAEHVGRGAVFVERKIERSRIQHDQTRTPAARPQPGSSAGPRAPPVRGTGKRMTIIYESSCTHFPNLSPRSAKSLNSSKLVPPGESNTTSPGLGDSAALSTASRK
jgi:hypothetical protein